MIDYFTKAAEIVLVDSKDARTVAHAFYDNWVCRYGCPRFLTTDNGTEFRVEFVHLLERLGIFHILAAAKHPQSNGAIERFNRTLKKQIKTHCHDFPKQWPEFLPQLRQAYMQKRHSATGFSPNEMLFGKALRLPVAVRDALAASVAGVATDHVLQLRERKQYLEDKALLTIQSRMMERVERRLRNCPQLQIEVGDSVWERTQPKGPLHLAVSGPYLVVGLNRQRTVATLETGQTARRPAQRFKRHVSQLVKHHHE